MDTATSTLIDPANPSTKRKRSTSPAPQPPPTKVAKTHSSHLQINYLTRQYPDILPLIASEDSLPSLLSLIQDYDGVLQRHESMAGNLGARPLGPILIKRFERLFESPPKVLKTHKEGMSVGWLDVVEFARNKPEQFNLEKTRDGHPVCQFYTKQCRVEITEEDYELIASGMPQKLIPPQPILEDEEKELGTLEILEKNLGHIVHLADSVSARARQLNHRLKNRKNAIIARRESEALPRSGTHSPQAANGSRTSASPTSGFVAVNARPAETNGTSAHTASAATRAELLSKFFTTSERALAPSSDEHRASNPSSRPRTGTSEIVRSSKPKTSSGSLHEGLDANASLLASTSPVPIPNTPSSLLPYTKPTPAERFDDAGPYKAEMVARMEHLQRGDRVLPPCDRCRRLHMDCTKNLTACLGCTKKHAKCSWKDVDEEELRGYQPPSLKPYIEEELASERSASTEPKKKEYKREGQGVADEELLGEDDSSSDEDDDPSQNDISPRSQDPIQVHVAGTLATRGSPFSPSITTSPPEQSSNGVINPQPIISDKIPSPPPAPVPAHAELAKIPSEIEEVEEMQASRVPNNDLGIQPSIEGTSVPTNRLNHIANDLAAIDNDVPSTTLWTDAPPTPPSPPPAPVVAQQPFSNEMKPASVVAPLADMVAKTEA